jgi:prepilin-type N-terminal cleavage/methylation domain-containing protein
MKKPKLYIKYRPAFTIVELLVVIVVIGVLAAITIISYTGIKDRAVKASLTSDLENVSKILTMDQVTNSTYPSTLSEANGGKGISANSGTTYEYFPSSTGFCIAATKDSTTYRVTNSSSPKQGVCSGLERDKLSVIKWASSWVVSTGAAPGYYLNGDGNSRVVDINPWGLSDIVWDVSNQDVASNDDGGWVTNNFPVDSTKMYRFSTFVRRKVIGDGNFYLGTNGYPDTVLNRSNGALNTNPYFCSKAWWGNLGQWYLVVGHVWPAGSGTGNAMTDSGIYTLNGTMISSTADFVWQSTTTSSRHRSYLYYSIDTTTNQQWYQPRVDIVDGTEPTINELLNNTF